MNLLRVKKMSNGRWSIYAHKKCLAKNLVTRYDARALADIYWHGRFGEADREILRGAIQYKITGVPVSYREALKLLWKTPNKLVKLIQEGAI